MKNGANLNRITVAFDYQIFVRQKLGGISKYFYEINKRIEENDSFKLIYPVIMSQNEYFKEKIPVSNIVEKSKLFNYLTRFVNKIYFLKHISSKDKCDIIHPTYYSGYFYRLKSKNTKYVLTVFDCIQELYAKNTLGNMRMKYLKKKAIERADAIISISESTKKDIIRLYNIPENKIDVVYLDCKESDGAYQLNTSFTPPQTYILYVGLRKGYKNFDTFIKAAGILSDRYEELRFVCVGSPFLKEEKKKMDALGIADRVIQVKANDDELNMLYKNAKCFVYPSMYEGFGIPVLEAFQNDCPVALSKIDCFVEIAGDAAAYFRPDSENQMAEVIDGILCDAEKRDELIRRGKERKKLFSWDNSAKQVADIYRRVISE